MSENAKLIQDVYRKVQEVKNSNSSCLVAFDLDATLFDVTFRLHQVMQDFANDPFTQKQFPHLIEKLKQIRFERTDWGITESLKRHGLPNTESFNKWAHDFWYERYFSNEYLEFDEPYEGAVDFVRKLWNSGAEIVYLTGRDKHRMGAGTVKVLKKWDFPLEQERATLVLKPEKGMDDAGFKADWFIENGLDKYTNIYFFENEPVNLQAMVERCPSVDLILFESGHSGKAHPPLGIPRIENYIGLSEK